MVGWLLQITKPSERDVRSFVEGHCDAGGTALGVAALFVVLMTGTRIGFVECDIVTPILTVTSRGFGSCSVHE